jgi:hypothetical protein
MTVKLDDATREQVAAAVRKAIAPLDVVIEVDPREFADVEDPEGHFGYIVTATLPNGMRRKFAANHIWDHYKPKPTLRRLAGDFAREISAAVDSEREAARTVAEVRSAVEAVLSEAEHQPLGIRLIDVAPRICDITFPGTELYLTVEMIDYDERLELSSVYFETDGAEHASRFVESGMPEQNRRHERARVLRTANAAGMVDTVTMRVLQRYGLDLPAALAKLERNEKVLISVRSDDAPILLVIHRHDGLVTCDFTLGGGPDWRDGVLRLYDDVGIAWAAATGFGRIVGPEVGEGLFEGTRVGDATVHGRAASALLSVATHYHDAEGGIMGIASSTPPILDRRGRPLSDRAPFRDGSAR